MAIHNGSNGNVRVSVTDSRRINVGISFGDGRWRDTWVDRPTARRIAYDLLATIEDQTDVILRGEDKQ